MKVLKSLSLTLLILNAIPTFAGDGVCPAERQDVCTKVIEVLNDALNKGLITKDQWDYEHHHLDIDVATYHRLVIEKDGVYGNGVVNQHQDHMLMMDIIKGETDKEFFDLVLGVIDEAQTFWHDGGKSLPKFTIVSADKQSSVSAAIDKTPTQTSAVPMTTLTPAIKVPTKPALDAKIKITKPQKSMPDKPDGRAAQRSEAAENIDAENQKLQVAQNAHIQSVTDLLALTQKINTAALDKFDQAQKVSAAARAVLHQQNQAIAQLNALKNDPSSTPQSIQQARDEVNKFSDAVTNYEKATQSTEAARQNLIRSFTHLQTAQSKLASLQNQKLDQPRVSRIGGGGKADNNPDVIRSNPNDRIMAGDRTGTLVLQGQALQGPSGVRAPTATGPDIVGSSGGLKVPPKPAAQAVPTPKPTPVAAPKPLPAKTHKLGSTNSKVVAYHLMKASQGSKGLHKTVSIVKQHPSKPTDNKTHKKSDVSKSHPEMQVSKKPGAPHLQDEKSFSQDENGRLWSCSISDMGMRRMVDVHGTKTVTGHSETLQYSSRILNHVPGLHVRDNRCLITVHK